MMSKIVKVINFVSNNEEDRTLKTLLLICNLISSSRFNHGRARGQKSETVSR